MSLSTPAVRSSTTGCTIMKLERITYDWVIREFKFFPEKNGECIYSPIFRTNNNEVEWRLCLFPRSDERRKSGSYASFDLCLHSHKSETINIEVHADISILPVETKRSLDHTYQAKGKHMFNDSIERSKLCDHDVVTIRCEMQIPLEIITEPNDTAQSMEQAFDSKEGQLIHDFRLLFKEPKFSDITIVVGPHKFPAHKVVLATRSLVFAAMFGHEETWENLKNEVKIERMEPDVVKAMLEFIYTDEVTNLEELAYGLLEAADKYDLQRLRSMCENVLCKTLDKENAAEILIHADLYRSYKLKEYVMDFMDDHLLNVVDTQSYEEMRKKYPELLNQLVRTIANRRK